ncbi:Acetyltransferase, GNAT family [uncultured Gammaproteobacteria bacterium]|nr:Acetyltransferase, GNAT family [uncultured Gammaproteobacteria bacterium]CAC9964196.1 Acetyltransferase, GNAT family [uncultured Gammaproteobacteria bacterium]
MKVLLDTNILLHRETARILNKDIGFLFRWFDKLYYEKCISPLSIKEIEKYKNKETVETIKTKLQNYNLLKTEAPETNEIEKIRKDDENENDVIDTSLLKEVFAKRVSYLITEDRGIHKKARLLNIEHLVFSINDFLEKVTAENPELSDYKVLSVKKAHFGDLDIKDDFFDSFRKDYKGFNDWFNSKSEEVSYVCKSQDQKIVAFLYVKVETEQENYTDIEPKLPPKKRLKIGTFKVISTGYKLGERFLKVIFDNALKYNVDEIYVTIFNKTDNQEFLISLLKDWGFVHHGVKNTPTGNEQVYIKDFHPIPNKDDSKFTYPFIDKNRQFFIVPIYPEYHTELLPDSILNNERPENFIDDKPHRNAIQKVYISRSLNKDLNKGDIILFYRTGGLHKSVITTIGIVDSVFKNIQNKEIFTNLCKKRSVFSDKDLLGHWNYIPNNRPFIVKFLYLYSFTKRLNMKRLIELNIIKDIENAPRGFEAITKEQFELILRESEANERFIID